MAHPRLSCYQILSAAFAKDPQLKLDCIARSNHAINRNTLTVIFNEFPRLIDEKNFKKLLDLVEANISNKDTPAVYIRAIARIACQDILIENEKNELQVNDELIKLLGWEAHQKKLNEQIENILCSFVEAVSESFIPELRKKLCTSEAGESAYKNFNSNVNQYRKWTEDTLRHYRAPRTAPSELEPEPFELVEEPNALGIPLGPVPMGVAAVMSLATMAGLLYFGLNRRPAEATGQAAQNATRLAGSLPQIRK